MRSDYLNKSSGVTNFDNKVEFLTASRTLTANDSGKVLVLSVAGGLTVTLPSAAPGLNFKFIVGTTFTTAGLINTAATDELYVGQLNIVDPATAGDMNSFSADVSNDDTIDLGSIEQGWLVGGWFNLVAISETRWHVEGQLVGDATLATPFE
jgi:hypothetical protein|tara:strand:+ start:36 stop:491 length:456 start_codon:yes stop_codon:yes gene_type:complete